MAPESERPPCDYPPRGARGRGKLDTDGAICVCLACGAHHREFAPDCSACGAAGAIELTEHEPAARAVLASELGAVEVDRVSSGFAELDRTLNGGWARGATVLIWGRPGSGKSRLAAQWCAALAPSIVCVLEQPAAHYCTTAHSAGADLARLHLLESSAWQSEAARLQAQCVAIDSISVCPRPVRALRELRAWTAQSNGIALCVSHVNKRGRALGPTSLEHWPDINLRVSAGKRGRAKILVVKSRFGASGANCELSIVRMEPRNRRA